MRFAVVCCFMLASVSLIGFIALLPAFLAAYTDEKSALAAISDIKKGKDSAGAGAIQTRLATDTALVEALTKGLAQPRLSGVVESVAGLRGTNRLSSVRVERAATTTVTVIVQGIAPTRETLLAFKNRLESLSPGNKVDLPVAQLAKGSNIQFSLRLTQEL